MISGDMTRRRARALRVRLRLQNVAFRHIRVPNGHGTCARRRRSFLDLHDFLFLGGERGVDLLHRLVRRFLHLLFVALLVVLGNRVIL